METPLTETKPEEATTPEKPKAPEEFDDRLPGPAWKWAGIPYRDKAYVAVKKDLAAQGLLEKYEGEPAGRCPDEK
jgi:hypothetical protein